MLVAETGKIYFQDSISKSILIGICYYVFHHLEYVTQELRANPVIPHFVTKP